jgi:hypothetical protein
MSACLRGKELKNPMYKRLSILFIFALFFSGHTVNAQSITGIQRVQFLVGPEAPGPNEQVTIEAQGVGGFLQDAKFVWQKDGRVVQSGIGQRTLTFTTGGVGVQTRIHVDIHSASTGDFSKDFTFTPANINLIWEADTTVPPLYRGKAFYSAGSKITLIALAQVTANGKIISPNSLSYQWSVGGEPVASASGIGRTVFSYYGNQLNQSERISLAVKYGGSTVGTAALVLPAVNPSVMFYVKDPLRGILFDQALPSVISLLGQELTLSAQPFNFSNESIGKTISYNWKLNGQPVTGDDTEKGVLTLRQSGSGQGQSVISLQLENSDNYKFLQNAATQLIINFGKQQNGTSGAFGI